MSDPNDDDLELELEPVDPEVLDFERRRAQQKSRQAGRAVDIDEIYQEPASEPLEFDLDWFKRIRFTTRHLLIVTALLAVLMTFLRTAGVCNTFFGVAVLGVAGGWFWVLRNEQRRNRERARRRAEIEARHAAEDAGEDYVPTFESPVKPSLGPSWLDARERESAPLDLRFSLKEMFIAFTVAAVMLSVLAFTSDPGTLAMLLGFVALTGLAVSALGFEPPRAVVLCWWLLLVMYLVVGLAAALGVGS